MKDDESIADITFFVKKEIDGIEGYCCGKKIRISSEFMKTALTKLCGGLKKIVVSSKGKEIVFVGNLEVINKTTDIEALRDRTFMPSLDVLVIKDKTLNETIGVFKEWDYWQAIE